MHKRECKAPFSVIQQSSETNEDGFINFINSSLNVINDI